jgi:hypothetical protein
MASSDRLVTSQHILKAVMEYERRGSTKVLADLETLEPDMVEYLLESLTRLHYQLTRLGLSNADARKIYRPAEKTAVVCIMALRNAHRDLWESDGDTSPPSPPPLSP